MAGLSIEDIEFDKTALEARKETRMFEAEQVREKESPHDEDTSKADGTSLALGSNEYKEYVRDRAGIDEHEQARIKQIEKGHVREAVPDGDEITERQQEYDESVSAEHDELVAEQATPGYVRDNSAIAARRSYKRAQLAAFATGLGEQVLSTTSKADDKLLERQLDAAGELVNDSTVKTLDEPLREVEQAVDKLSEQLVEEAQPEF